MNKHILHSEIQNYINKNLNSDISKILFKGISFPQVTTQEIVEQIEAKRKCKEKLPTWFSTENIYYPNKLNIEQASSEITAQYKANLISGKFLIDITGGLGVDCYFFSKKINSIMYCEINENLSEIVTHNFRELGIKNVQTISGDGLANLKRKFDWIYIDPSRRNSILGKVFLLKDCHPNVPENLELLFKKSSNILIKCSPILDIKSTINELKYVKEIHIIATHNEVKELLFVLKKNYEGSIQIKTINIQKENTQFFNFEFGKKLTPSYSPIKKYLYEPNAAILKSGGFNQVAKQFLISKLHQHSHLYTSNEWIDFPGRIFEVQHCISFDKKKLNKLIPTNKANITTRNFPQTVSQIREKTGLKEGGNQYLFFTTDMNEKYIVVLCKKV